jgi:zinc transporter, ZIP family
VAEAFAWGLIAASSLLLGGFLALQRPIGLIVAFGAGVLISAVSYCNRYRGAARNSNASGSSTGSAGFR